MSVTQLTKLVPLGAAGLRYVQSHLSGVNTLCTALLELTETEPGDVFTLAPVSATREQLLQFEAGGLLPTDFANVVNLSDGSTLTPIPNLGGDQAKWLRGLLKTADDVCIIDDFNPTWEELKATDDIEDTFGVSDEAYHLLTREHDEALFAKTLTSTHTIWHGVACITSYAPELDADGEASADDLRAAAYAATAITCVAYDGEGFVAWRRTSQ